MENCVHLQTGKYKKVAVVLSCPGRHEETAGHPAAKGTGRNLDMLLSLLGAALARDDLFRENVTVTNAWPRVEYKARTGRTEASEKEITAPENIERLEQELREITDFVIFCGRSAAAAGRHLKLAHHPAFLFVEHLGLRGLSMIHCDATGKPIVPADRMLLEPGCTRSRREIQCENTRKRLEALVRSLVAQLRPQ